MSEALTRSLSVLIVEDQEDTAQSTAELVTMSGHAVRIANCGTDALRQAEVEPPDVVFLDIGLPGMDGWDVAVRLRDLAAGKQPLIVAVTGYADEADRRRSESAGIDLHWPKPADPAALIRLLDWVGGLLLPKVVRALAPV